MKISRRTLTWAAISAVPVLTAFAFAGKNFVSVQEAKVSSPTFVHHATPIAPQVQVASALGRHRLHLKRGHTYQLSTTDMSSVVGADTSYAPGSVVTLPSYYGACTFGDGGSGSFVWVIGDDNNDGGTNGYPNGWHLARPSTNILTVSIPNNAVPGDYTAFWHTGTVRFSSSRTSLSQIDPIGGNGPQAVGYSAYFTVN